MSKINFIDKRLLILLPLCLVVLVSGCTNTPVTGNGVQITNFVSDFPQVRSGEEVNLLLEVQNTGTVRATNVRAELTGITTADWGTFSPVIEIGDLLAADTEVGTPGEKRSVQWTRLSAPYHAKGTEFPYTPQVRVSYDYTTTAQKPITVVDRNELRRIIAARETLPGKETTYTSGPLTVQITTGNYVQSSSQFGNTYDIFPVNIHIENSQFTSGSTVVPPLIGFGAESYPVLVTINPPTGTNFVYSGYGQDCSRFVVVDLFQGRTVDITCELEVTSPPTIKQEGLLMVDLEYRYAIDSTTSIKVIGT